MTGFGEGRTLAIANPTAGGGRVRRHLQELVGIFRKEHQAVDLVQTGARGDAARLAREAATEGYYRVIAVGGDGTVHEVANGILGAAVRLAVVPLGRSNDFARGLGWADWRAAARHAASGAFRRVDVALVNGRAVVNCVGVGPAAAHPRRSFPHVLSTLLARPAALRVSVDGRASDGRHLFIVVANGGRFGGGLRIAPQARIDDGMLDVCAVGDASAVESLALLVRAPWGRHVGHPKVQLQRARQLVIEQDERRPVQLDGEVSVTDHLEITCLAGGLMAVTPP